MRVLALALGVPFPPVGGGLTRTFHLLKALASHHEVQLLGFTYGEEHDPPAYPVQVVPVPWCRSADYAQMTGADLALAHAATDRLTYQVEAPWFVSVLDPSAMTGALHDALATRPDVVLFEGTPLAQFASVLPRGLPRVLDLFDLHSLMARRALDDAGANAPEGRALAREAERTLAFERRAVRASTANLVVSHDDAVAARALLGAARVHVVPNGVDTSYFAPTSEPPEPGAILFTGRMSYEPNADAACHFAQEVLPLVRRQAPHARFHIVGVGPPQRVSALQSPSVIVHGRVDDVRPYQRQAEVVVVPVRTGGGTRLKVLEAAASGKSIVSTRLGVEGLPFRPELDVIVADAPADLAAAVVTLLRDPARRAQLGARARDVACHFDWAAIGDSCRRIVEQAASRG